MIADSVRVHLTSDGYWITEERMWNEDGRETTIVTVDMPVVSDERDDVSSRWNGGQHETPTR